MESVLEQLRTALKDRYRVDAEIGRGGMATVFRAQDLKYDRPVAIKVLSPDISSVVSAERFSREIRISARLSHPNILTVFDSGEVGELLYYVMTYVEGESLRARMKRETYLPMEDAIRITCEVADALSYAHEQGVIHRDIKPENILLRADHCASKHRNEGRRLHPVQHSGHQLGVVSSGDVRNDGGIWFMWG